MDAPVPEGAKAGKYYMLTDAGMGYIRDYKPKDNGGEKKAHTKTRKVANKASSAYTSINADDLNLGNYPAVKSLSGAKEQVIMVMYIVTSEGKGEWFTVDDVIYLLVMPDSQKQKISEALKGKKTSRGMLGHFHSDETKLRMSIAAKGKPKPHMVGKGNPRARAVVNCNTGERFDTIQSASVKYGCNRVGITRCCEKRQETCGGYRWAYTGDD